MSKERYEHCCCFTGHRPEKLAMPEHAVKAALEHKIQAAITDGYHTFISGMARGVDIWAAEIVLRLRAGGQPVRLICASPYEGFETRWRTVWQARYRRIIDAADLVRYISPGYHAACFQVRNEWMVDHSARVIAVYNGSRGGTRNTLEYAEAKGLSIIQVYGVSI